MEKRNMEKRFLLSILVSGVLLSCGVNSNNNENLNTTEDSEAIIIDNPLTAANKIDTNEIKEFSPEFYSPLPQEQDTIDKLDVLKEQPLELNLDKLEKQNVEITRSTRSENPNNSISTWLGNIDNIFSLLNLVVWIVLGTLLIYYLRQISKSLSINHEEILKETNENLNEIKEVIAEGNEYYQYPLDNSKIEFSESQISSIVNKLQVIFSETKKNNREISNNSIKLIETIEKSFLNLSKEVSKALIEKNLKSYNRLTRENESSEDAGDFEHKQQSSNHEQESHNLNKNTPISAATSNIVYTSKDLEVLENLVTNYNAKALKKQQVYKVAATRESIEEIRTGVKASLILKQDNNDSYWILSDPRSPKDNYYLVPKYGLVINDRIYQTVEDIFICQGYKNRASNTFKLIRPAIVKFLKNNEWKLLHPGELKFDEN